MDATSIIHAASSSSSKSEVVTMLLLELLLLLSRLLLRLLLKHEFVFIIAINALLLLLPLWMTCCHARSIPILFTSFSFATSTTTAASYCFDLHHLYFVCDTNTMETILLFLVLPLCSFFLFCVVCFNLHVAARLILVTHTQNFLF